MIDSLNSVRVFLTNTLTTPYVNVHKSDVSDTEALLDYNECESRF